jgi:hypothetical protein
MKIDFQRFQPVLVSVFLMLESIKFYNYMWIIKRRDSKF